jgi:hypothetical protein
MPLPQITNPAPVVIPAVPAVEEKRYDEAFIVGLVLSSRAAADQQLLVTLRPYNYAASELYPGADADSRFIVDNVWAEAARVPAFAQVMGGICQVTSLLVREKQLVAVAEPTAEQVAELAAVRTELGIS